MNIVPKFLWSLPSVVTEACISAPVTVALALGAAWLALHAWWGLLIVATLLSLLYERFVDPNGFAWDDVGQRQGGIVLVVFFWWMATR